MPRPTEFLDWVTSGDPSKVVDPPAGQKANGWVANQKPPARYFNWLFYQTDLWLKWFDSISITGQTRVTAGTTANGQTRTYLCDPSGGAFNFILPLASGAGTYRVTIKNVAIIGSNSVTIQRSGSDTMEGTETSYVLGPLEAMTFEAEAATNTWWSVGGG